ncbi:hypothetical protein ACFLZ1_01145 [Patescibacteria group bacterium]
MGEEPPVQAAPEPITQPANTETPPENIPPEPQKKSWIWIVIGIVFVALLLGGIIYGWWKFKNKRANQDNGKITSSRTAIPTVTHEAKDRIVIASGWISKDSSVTLEPWYEFEAPAKDSVAGTYSVEAVDFQGQVLASNGFDVSFILLSNPPTDTNVASFEVIVAYPVGTSAFRIKKGELVLAERDVSMNEPSVKITAPALGELVVGEYTITWESDDLDGDMLYHNVEYSHNGEDWLVLDALIEENKLQYNFDNLPGGKKAQIQLLVTDGVNTTMVQSETFEVGYKKPDAFIERPTNGSSFEKGHTVMFYGSGYDPQDGSLNSSDELEWSSSKQGVIGKGGALALNTLSVGDHVITLSATNSLGVTSTSQVRISITE